MLVRKTFVSNSSSSSFVVNKKTSFKSFLNCICYLVSKANWYKGYEILENLNIQFSSDKECRKFLKNYIEKFNPRNSKIQDYCSKNDRNYDYHISYSDYDNSYLTIKALAIDNIEILKWIRDTINNYDIKSINITEDMEEWDGCQLTSAMIRSLFKVNNIEFESYHVSNTLEEMEDIIIGKKEMVTL